MQMSSVNFPSQSFWRLVGIFERFEADIRQTSFFAFNTKWSDMANPRIFPAAKNVTASGSQLDDRYIDQDFNNVLAWLVWYVLVRGSLN